MFTEYILEKYLCLLEYIDEFNTTILHVRDCNLNYDEVQYYLKNFKIINMKIVNDIIIYTINYQILYKNTEIQLEIKCKHNKIIQYKRLNKMPHLNWEELVDSWSCHKSEFKSLKNINIKSIDGRIMIGDFFCVIPKINIPYCCKTNIDDNCSVKIFYNELHINISDNKIIYDFFKEYFYSYYTLFLNLNIIKLEIRYLYDCNILLINNKSHQKQCKAIKIAVRITNKVDDIKEINDYYKNAILNHIKNNNLNIKFNDYTISYITDS